MSQATRPLDAPLLTRHEEMLLSFWEKGLRASAENQVQLTFILTDPPAQTTFENWLTRAFEAPLTLDHAQLVNSVWFKTLAKVTTDLRSIGEPSLSQEVELLKKAQTQMKECADKMKPGRSFTLRQVKVLLDYAGSIKK